MKPLLYNNWRYLALSGILCLTMGAFLSPAFAEPTIAQPPAVATNPATTPEEITPAFDSKQTATLQALDKITARVSELKAPVGSEIKFGSLKIAVRACKKSTPLEPPEAAAFVQITEQKPGSKLMDAVFSGWMFASSPALSAMEHPVYDIWVKDCN